MDRIIVFIGPSLVGKTTVSKRLSICLKTNKISTDTLCLHHTYHQDDPEESIELFDDLKRYIDQNNVRIVDIGSNTIESCSHKELDYLKKVLTINEKEPAFYLLLPSQNDDISFQYLSKVAKKLYGNNPEIQLSLKTSLSSPAYKYLNPTIIHTLEGYKPPLLFQKNAYVSHLETRVSDTIINDFVIKKNLKR